MCRRHVQFWASVPAVAFLGFLASVEASGQDPLATAPLAQESAAKADASDKGARNSISKTDNKAKAAAEPEFVVKTDAEWRKILTRAQFAVTRQKATEPAFSGTYATGHYRGNFLCVDCDRAGFESVLFSSQHKFESGTGWPSFYRAANERALQTAPDYSGFEPRVEVMCRRCGAHLGHVFDDGPAPTGLRFCINSVAIKLKSPDAETRPRPALSKTTSKSKTRTRAKTGATLAPKGTQSKGPSVPPESERPPAGDQPPGDAQPRTSGT
jgi:peptide-methionine (R)-S-oxide reductase